MNQKGNTKSHPPAVHPRSPTRFHCRVLLSSYAAGCLTRAHDVCSLQHELDCALIDLHLLVRQCMHGMRSLQKRSVCVVALVLLFERGTTITKNYVKPSIPTNYVNPSIPKEKNCAEVFTKWVQTLKRFRGGKDRKTH